MKSGKLYPIVKRVLDIVISLSVGFLFSPIVILIIFIVKFTSEGPVLFWSDRIGKNNVTFRMPKFRTMKMNTPAVATHMLKDAKSHLTPLGGFLRKTSLDELPQLWSVVAGNMSLIGPRPALYNQSELITLRTRSGVHTIRPGITGWAQINGRDELSIPDKVALDKVYLEKQGFSTDMKIFFATVFVVLWGKSVSH